jgi:hypothetical protein
MLKNIYALFLFKTNIGYKHNYITFNTTLKVVSK